MLKEHPGAKLAVLYRNDDFGKDYVTGLRDVLGKDSDKYVVRTATNEVTDPIVDSQISDLHAVVAEGSLLVVAVDVVQAANDKQQLEPMLNQIVAMLEVLGKAETMLADNGYLSAANVAACEAAAVQPLIAMGREAHHPSLSERFAGAPPPPENPTPVEAMAYRLATPEARSSIACANKCRNRCSASSSRYSSCCAGSTRCMASGVLVTMARNLKRMFTLCSAR